MHLSIYRKLHLRTQNKFVVGGRFALKCRKHKRPEHDRKAHPSLGDGDGGEETCTRPQLGSKSNGRPIGPYAAGWPNQAKDEEAVEGGRRRRKGRDDNRNSIKYHLQTGCDKVSVWFCFLCRLSSGWASVAVGRHRRWVCCLN